MWAGVMNLRSNLEVRQNSYCRFAPEKQDVYSLASFLSVSRAKTLATFAGRNEGFYQVSIDEIQKRRTALNSS